jgi:hypothetical protein
MLLGYDSGVPEWKYSSHLSLHADCPPQEARPYERTAFRFVWNPVTHGSFIPVALKPPRRMNRPSPNTCSAYGLSMFATEAQARTHFAKLERMNREIRKAIGTHLASLALTADHGAQTLVSSNGHFDLHEYKDTDLVSVSTIVGAL